MGENTKIEWADHTASFWEGCVKVSPGCAHCYAESFEKRVGNDVWGKLKPRKWTKGGPALIRKLNKKAAAAGRIDTVFVNDLGDFFEDFAGPVVDHQGHRVFHENFGYTVDPEFPAQRDNPCLISDLRADAFRLFDECQNLIFMLLTKRPENIRRMWPGYRHISNCWLGTSCSDQPTADKAIPELLKCRDLAAKLFVSAEPLIGHIDFSEWFYDPCHCLEEGYPDPETNVIECRRCDATGISDSPSFDIDICITGGESGPKARPCNVDWIRDIGKQCKTAGVAWFNKQLGSRPVWPMVKTQIAVDDFAEMPEWGEMRDPKGGNMDEWPEDLRVRQLPLPPRKLVDAPTN